MADPRVDKVRELVRPWCHTPDEEQALAVTIVAALCGEVDDETGLAPGGNHALLVGRLMGVLMKDDGEQHSGFQPLGPRPVMTNAGDYTNKITVTQPSGTYVITVEEA